MDASLYSIHKRISNKPWVLQATQQLRIHATTITTQMYMFGYPQTIPETMKRRRQHMKKTKLVPTNIRHTTTGWLNRVRQAADDGLLHPLSFENLDLIKNEFGSVLYTQA